MAPAINVPVSGIANMTPDYEIKLLLDPTQVLESNHELKKIVLTAFDIQKAVKMNIQFVDKCSKEIDAAGWSLRIRKAEGQSKVELTYKKRYNIEDGNIDDALAQANNDGFNVQATEYEAQVEWGFAKQTLSISRDEKVPYSGKSQLDLPDTQESRKLLVKEAPDEFDNWEFGNNRGTKALETTGIFGPVLATRWVGEWNPPQLSKTKLTIEVWRVLDSNGTGLEPVVEVSIKAGDPATASRQRDMLIADIKGKGWLIERDSLRTKLILERYSCPRVSGRKDA
ncbi:hypothetical protein GGI35DRAFT_434515 [Trichoderma velutinum]